LKGAAGQGFEAGAREAVGAGGRRCLAKGRDSAMKTRFGLALALASWALGMDAWAAEQPARPLPAVVEGWSIELAAEAPRIVFPTAIVAAPDDTVYLGSDPMDMPGPPTEPIDRVVAMKSGKLTVFAERLWSVMGLESDGETLFVVHAPFLSAFRDTDRDGVADERVDLMTGLGPKLPGASGLNDHIASGIRLGVDGFLYIAVGDKGIPRGVGKDGKTVQLFGGGVIRIRPDGSDLEVVSTGECNPLSIALSATDEIFTYGNDDDSKKWPNSLTHHIVGGHYGYPYQFLTSPTRALPIMTGLAGGVGTQGICYNEDGLPGEYRGNLFFCDWGLQAVFRFEIRKSGGTHAVTRRTVFVSKGGVNDFRPFSIAVSSNGASLWLVDWAYTGWRADGPRSGRLYRLHYPGANAVTPAPRPSGSDPALHVRALDHPALSVRRESQRVLTRMGPPAVGLLVDRLQEREPETGRLHALWALDALAGAGARAAIRAVLTDPAPRVRLQAARSAGIRGDRAAGPELSRLLSDRDAAVRREAAIALGKLGDSAATPALYAALGDADTFAAWSIRQAIRRLGAWDKDRLVAALLDERRLEPALRLTDEAWAIPVVAALTEAFGRTSSAAVRGRIAANLAGLYRQYPEWSGIWFGSNPLAAPFPRKNKDWSPEGMRAVLDGLSPALVDGDRMVRFQAIVGLAQAGKEAAPRLRGALVRETDIDNQAALVEALGEAGDAASEPVFAAMLADAGGALQVRSAALRALARFRDRRSLGARLTLVYDEKAPAPLVAAALVDLARLGVLPPNDLASFFQHREPEVRAAALLSLNVKKALPPDVRQSVLDALEDKSALVRQAAMLAVVPLQLRAAVPRLVSIASNPSSPERSFARDALLRLPDPRAVSVYRDATRDSNPLVRKAGESALRSIGLEVAQPAVRPADRPATVDELRRFALDHPGDARNGEAIFFGAGGAGCGQCHSAGGRGTASIGPDLTGLASKYDRAEVIRSVLEPSSRIATGYQSVVVSTRAGKMETGLLRAETDHFFELADSEARIKRIPKTDVELVRAGNVSVMPARSAEMLSPADFADLIGFLMSLKQVPQR
jgi:putative heme-binding domain-containing protein